MALNVTEVRPVALTVNVAAPVLVLSAVTVTLCADAKFDGVNVSELPAVTDRPVFPEVRATDTVTFDGRRRGQRYPDRPGAALGDVLRGGSHHQAGRAGAWTGTSVAVTTAEV